MADENDENVYDVLRNPEDLNLDEITEDFLQNQAEEEGIAKGVDTRQGSLYMDAAEGHIIRVSKFFDDLRQIKTMVSLSTCTGDILTEKMHENGLFRNPPEPTSAKYYAIYDGALPRKGDIVTVAGHQFTVSSVEGSTAIIESDETGETMNSLVQGTPVLPQVDIDGLVSCTLGEIAEPALDAEGDDEARARLLSKLEGPAENGNAAHVQSWCESVEGVGRARIVPLWNGPQTVEAIIINTDGRAPTSQVVKNVQNYVDPGSSGMGEGMAAIGQFVTIVGAKEVPVNVSVTIVRKSGSTIDDVKDELTASLEDYFKTIALQEKYSEDIQVRYNRVSATITEMESVLDHEGLLLNGNAKNVAFSINEIPVLGTVTVNDSV